jgi:hypothetical protein
MDFGFSPPVCGRSVTDFWGWDAHEAQLRCPDEMDGDFFVLKDTRMDWHGEANSRFRDFAHLPKMFLVYSDKGNEIHNTKNPKRNV